MLGVPKHTAILEMKSTPPANFPASLKKFSLRSGIVVEQIHIHPGPKVYISLKLAGRKESAISFLNSVISAFKAYIQNAKLQVDSQTKPLEKVRV